MEPRKRTHLVNELMQEANLMMAVLEKAMQGERFEEMHPALHGIHYHEGHYSLEDEHKAWGKILRALSDVYTELDRIEHSERQRIEHIASSAYAYAGDGIDAED